MHRLIPHAIAALGIALSSSAAMADGPLVGERWKTRPVVVVVSEANDPLLAKVRAALKEPVAREAFRERDMSLYVIAAGQGSRNDVPLEPQQTEALLHALDLNADGPSTFVLVGKDGGVKMREGADVDLQAVFENIDRMPMRNQR